MSTLHSEKMLMCGGGDVVLESYTTTVSWKSAGWGNTGSTSLFPPCPSGKTINLNSSANPAYGLDTGITVEKGYLYRFTVMSNGLEGMSDVGMLANTLIDGWAYSFLASLWGKCTNVFHLSDSNGTLRNSMKQGSVGYFSPNTTSNLGLNLFRKQTSTNFSGSTNILIEKLPLDFISPEYYYYENTSSSKYTWNTTGIAPSGYTRNCEGDIYINVIP